MLRLEHFSFSPRESVPIALIPKSQNAPVPCPIMLNSKQIWHILVLNGALWDMEQVHSRIYEISRYSPDPSDSSHMLWWNAVDLSVQQLL